MGAAEIVTGGQTMNPSIQELLAAVESARTAEVILLPNNRNILLTANQVPALAAKRTAVVPSHSVPQGLAALAAFNPDDALDANVRRMTAALTGVRTVEVTRAVRDATIDDVRATQGQVIGLVDDRMVAAGDEVMTVAVDALARAGLDQAELVTVFLGEGAIRDQADALQTRLVANRPRLTVEIHDGNQPHYLYVIAVE
jgi:dihydroxyacetone kinase-like predicted kinase